MLVVIIELKCYSEILNTTDGRGNSNYNRQIFPQNFPRNLIITLRINIGAEGGGDEGPDNCDGD